MKVELDVNEMKNEKRETRDECESLVEGPQVLIICHCCGAAVFVDEKKIKEQRESENEKRETKEDDGA